MSIVKYKKPRYKSPFKNMQFLYCGGKGHYKIMFSINRQAFTIATGSTISDVNWWFKTLQKAFKNLET